MLYFWAMNTKATGVGGINDPDGEADRSAAEIPSERDGTRTRDLSARVARTVLPEPSVELMAGPTGLEPATSGVTGRRSIRLNYDPGGARRERLL